MSTLWQGRQRTRVLTKIQKSFSKAHFEGIDVQTSGHKRKETCLFDQQSLEILKNMARLLPQAPEGVGDVKRGYNHLKDQAIAEGVYDQKKDNFDYVLGQIQKVDPHFQG